MARLTQLGRPHPDARERRLLPIIGCFALTSLVGCGTYVPQMQEVWDDPRMSADFEFRIKENIFCETVAALRYVNDTYRASGGQVIPNDYGVQMQITLTVEETGSVNPGVTFIRTLTPPTNTFNLGLGGTLSSTATRVDTSYSYYNVGRITAKGANASCDDPRDKQGSSPLLTSNLGIREYLVGAAKAAVLLPSSLPPAKGGASLKLDVYTYDIKFAIVSSGNVNPSWKLVNISNNTSGAGLFGAGRTRTHDLTLTFGPGTDQPTLAALQAHFTTQVVQSNQRATRP
jgi:hypothetical protein